MLRRAYGVALLAHIRLARPRQSPLPSRGAAPPLCARSLARPLRGRQQSAPQLRHRGDQHPISAKWSHMRKERSGLVSGLNHALSADNTLAVQAAARLQTRSAQTLVRTPTAVALRYFTAVRGTRLFEKCL